jgi:hypothetical protein
MSEMQRLRDRWSTFKGSTDMPRNFGIDRPPRLNRLKRLSDGAFATWSIILAVAIIVLLGRVFA